MGSVVAGDLLLALAGQLPPTAVRERCGHCVMRHTARREGAYGPYVQAAAAVYDACRWVSWQLERRLRRVRW
jgi:hypothetical protein